MALFTHFLKRRKREKGQGWGYDTTQAAKKNVFQVIAEHPGLALFLSAKGI
jgi:hypothetical protein